MNIEVKYWILLALSRSSDKRGVDITKLFFSERPDIINFDFNQFLEHLKSLENDGYIKRNEKSFTPTYFITKKAERELSKNINSDAYIKVVKYFPDIELKNRIETIEGFIFSVGVLIAVYLTLTNYTINNSMVLAILIGILLLSFGMVGQYFTNISNLSVEKYKIKLIYKLNDFIEDNKHWLGYGIVVIFTIFGIFLLKKFGFTNNQIIGGIVLELILLLLLNIKKINQYVQSIKILKEK